MTHSHSATTSPARILIVDDERRNRQLIEVILAAEGYAFESATSGAEALAAAAQRTPDLVLLDIMMPGMNGYQVVTALKADAATKHVPVIMLSALDDNNSRAHGRTMGADAFLAKPVDRTALCALVREVLGARAPVDVPPPPSG